MDDVHARTASTRSGSRSTSSPTRPRAGAGPTSPARPLGRAAPEPSAGAVPLGRLRRRREPRPRQPPAPLVEPLRDAGRAARRKIVDTIRCPIPGVRSRRAPTAADAARAASPTPADRRRDELRRPRRRQAGASRRARGARRRDRSQGAADGATATATRGGRHGQRGGSGARDHAGGVGRERPQPADVRRDQPQQAGPGPRQARAGGVETDGVGLGDRASAPAARTATARPSSPRRSRGARRRGR